MPHFTSFVVKSHITKKALECCMIYHGNITCKLCVLWSLSKSVGMRVILNFGGYVSGCGSLGTLTIELYIAKLTL